MNSLTSILGVWKSNLNDEATIKNYGSVVLEFKSNGELIYTINEEGKQQVIRMTYEVVNNKIITDQPSQPGKEETDFRVFSDGKELELIYNGAVSKYIRVD